MEGRLFMAAAYSSCCRGRCIQRMNSQAASGCFAPAGTIITSPSCQAMFAISG